MVGEQMAGSVPNYEVPGDILGAAWTNSNTLAWPTEAREDSRSSIGGGFKSRHIREYLRHGESGD